MNTGKIEVIHGDGDCGKTSLAMGRGIEALTRQKDVIVIQFVRGSKDQGNMEVVSRLEPEMKVFCFEKADRDFDQLSEEEKQEECLNIRNGLNYARKVLATGECDLLVLDGILKLLGPGILKEEELTQLLDSRDEADVVLTGDVVPDWLCSQADRIEQILLDKVEMKK